MAGIAGGNREWPRHVLVPGGPAGVTADHGAVHILTHLHEPAEGRRDQNRLTFVVDGVAWGAGHLHLPFMLPLYLRYLIYTSIIAVKV
jgi:hypothetical protein